MKNRPGSHFVKRHNRKRRGAGGRTKVTGYWRKTRKLGKATKAVKTGLSIKKGGRTTRYRIMKDKNGLFVGVRRLKK